MNQLLSVTNIIIAITCLVSVSALANRQLLDLLKFNAYMIRHSKEVWRFITHVVVHANFLHLGLNMYVLYMFGNVVENFLFEAYDQNKLKTVLIYFSFYVTAGIASSLVGYEKHKNDLWQSSVGASGAIAALVFAYIAIDPGQSLYIIFLPGIPIPGFILGLLYLVYSWYMGRKKHDNIDHDAHLFGAIYGFLFIFIIMPPLFKNFIRLIGQYFQQLFS